MNEEKLGKEGSFSLRVIGFENNTSFVASQEKYNSQIKKCLNPQIKYKMVQYDHLLLMSQKDLGFLMGTFREIKSL